MYFKNLVLMGSLSFILTGCSTFTVNLIHSEGTSSDLIDETDDVEATPSLTIPAKLL
jgi:starvation-inducible outer membrane lipoprotein